MTTEANNPVTPEVPEVKNPAGLAQKNRELLAKNADLTARVAELEAQLAQTQESAAMAQEAAQRDQAEWKLRWYQEAVEKPLMAEIQAAAAVPAKYLRDIAVDMGLLKMQPGEDGMNRPHWLDETGAPADLKHGLHRFLCSVHGRLHKDGGGTELGRALRGTGASGGGATGNGWRAHPAAAPEPAPAPARPALGLR